MKLILPRRFPLLPRKKNTDKSDYGHVLVLAGSRGLTGAAALTSVSALRCGSGLVTLGIPSALESFFSKKLLEVMRLGLPATAEDTLSMEAYPRVMDFIKKRKISCLAIGPGLSRNPQTAALVRKLFQNAGVPMVVDADAVNAFEGRQRLLSGHAGPFVMTPHKREFERVFEETLPKEQSKRIRLAKILSKFYHGVLVIKGPRTLVVEKDNFYVNRTGNPGLAKGGAGDVLTGMVASFIGQGLDPFKASAWAVYLHGKAGDAAARQKGELSMTAGDVIEALPKVLKSLE
jgi:NAD(P)H-hydrate epimerase